LLGLDELVFDLPIEMGVVAIYHVRTINEPYLPEKRLRYYAKSPLSIKLDPSLTLSPETSIELVHL